MKESEHIARATNPKQYDLPDLQWDKESAMESPRIFFFHEYLKAYIPSWKDKRVFEIGTGNGWLLDRAQKQGATDVAGIEPAEKSVQLAKDAHPELSIECSNFEEFDAKGKQYEVVVSVMVFSHIQDTDAAFTKIHEMLSPGGELIIVVPDFAYFRRERKDYVVEISEIDADQYVVQITRPTGTIADIVRTNDYYRKSAEGAGLRLVEEVAMTPTDDYLAKNPQFATSKEFATSQLFRFERS